MKECFFVKIESLHLPDWGTTENAHGLSKEELLKREVIYIDIANDGEYLYRAVIGFWKFHYFFDEYKIYKISF